MWLIVAMKYFPDSLYTILWSTRFLFFAIHLRLVLRVSFPSKRYRIWYYLTKCTYYQNKSYIFASFWSLNNCRDKLLWTGNVNCITRLRCRIPTLLLKYSFWTRLYLKPSEEKIYFWWRMNIYGFLFVTWHESKRW